MKIVSNDARTLHVHAVERYARASRTLRLHDKRGVLKVIMVGLIAVAVFVAVVLRSTGH